MKTKILSIIFAVAAVMSLSSCSTYNEMVTQEENVNAKFSEIDNQYQRRSDLVPNLVEAVKAAGARESKTFTQVIEARAKATQVTIDASNLTEENLAAYQKAQGELGMALSRLMAVSESYPDLKTNQNFLNLQEELTGTENRILVTRTEYNSAAQEYNTNIRLFPKNLIAMIFSFKAKPYFQADEEAKHAPKVDFGYEED